MTSTINETEVYRMLDQITELKAKLARQEQLLNSVAKSYDEKLTQAYMSGGIKESTRRIIKEWQLFAGEKATENGLIAEQLEFTVRIAQDWQARAEAAERDLANVQLAAHMPDDYPYGLSSWINQHLYAAYIGAQFPAPVMEQIRMGRLTFPDAPVYAELAQAHARVAELEAQLAAQWRPVTEPPTEPGTYLVYDADGEPYLFTGVWPYRVAKWNNGWGSGLDGLVDYWRPLPAPPID